MEIMKKYQIDIQERLTKQEGSMIIFGDLVSKKPVFHGRLDSYHDTNASVIGSLAYLQVISGKGLKPTSPNKEGRIKDEETKSTIEERVEENEKSPEAYKVIRVKKTMGLGIPGMNKPSDDVQHKKVLLKSQQLAEAAKVDMKPIAVPNDDNTS